MSTEKYNPNFNNQYTMDTGFLDASVPQKSAGKKVFDWKYYAKRDGKSVVVDIPVYLRTQDDKLIFVAISRLFEEGAVKDTDIDRLRQKVAEVMRLNNVSITGIEWEDWFQVTVERERSGFTDSGYSSMGALLKIDIAQLKRGTDPVTGRDVTINVNRAVTDFPKPRRIDEDDERGDGGLIFRDRPKEVSYIPATPENRRALEDIMNRMHELGDNLAEFLRQDKIMNTLERIKFGPLLTDESEASDQPQRPARKP